MINHVHPLVLATVTEHRAKRDLELERLRSARAACTTATPGGQSRALALGKRIREVEKIVSGWRLAEATLSITADVMSESAGDRIVGSRSAVSGAIRCVPCTRMARKKFPHDGGSIQDVTSEDLSDGGMCSDCHVDVLA